jgi:hypothetical protein
MADDPTRDSRGLPPVPTAPVEISGSGIFSYLMLSGPMVECAGQGWGKPGEEEFVGDSAYSKKNQGD